MGVVSAAGVANGTGTVMASGSVIVAVAGISLGRSTPIGVAGLSAAGVGVSDGAGNAKATYGMVAAYPGCSLGSGAAIAPGTVRASAVGASNGTGTAKATARAIVSGVGIAPGSSTAITPGTVQMSRTGVATGGGSPIGAAATNNAVRGAATGASSPIGAGGKILAAPGRSAGYGSPIASASILGAGTGVSNGIGTVTGEAPYYYTINLSDTWIAIDGGRTWRASMGAVLVQNQLAQSVLRGSTVRLGMDWGDMTEIIDGGEIESFTVSIMTSTTPALTYNASSLEVTNGFVTSAVFSGGTRVDDQPTSYDIKFTATLSSGQVLPSRTGVLVLS